MLKKWLSGSVLAALVVLSASAQDASTVIANASRTIGVESLKTVQYSATGLDFALGQAPNPSSPWPKFINKSYTRAIDFETPASKVDRVRMQGENPPHGGGQQPIVGEQPQSQTIVVTAETRQGGHPTFTRSHVDHSSGLRAFVAEGTTPISIARMTEPCG